MRVFRLPLIAAGVVVLVLGATAVVAFNSGFQTWAVRKALARRPDLHLTVGAVDAGWRQVRVRDVRFEQGGVVWTAPQVDAELSVWPALTNDKLDVRRLHAKGWTLDLSRAAAGGGASVSASSPSAPGAVVPPGAPTPPGAATTTTTTTSATTAPRTTANPATPSGFAGIFGYLRLPVDVTLGEVQLEGGVTLPAGRGSVAVTVRGGGLGAGRDGKFDVVADATLTDPKVQTVQVRGSVVAAMDTPRSFTQVATNFEAAASGTQFPQGVKLAGGATAARAATGESYALTLVGVERHLIAIKAELPRDATRLDGTWKLDLRDADVAPFALGQPLPAFTAAGEGKFDTNAAFSAVHVTGRLNATAGRLEALQPQLAAIGVVKLSADFDVAQHGDTIGVQHLQAAVSAAHPIATVTALQSFEFNPRTAAVRATDVERELVGIALHALPLAWAKPFLGDVVVTGNDARGELVASARGGGVTLRSRTPLALEKLAVDAAGRPLVRGLDVSGHAVVDYTPQGWQAEVSGLAARAGGVSVALLDMKAGQLAGAKQPLKAAGKLSVNLVTLLQQPALAQALALTGGECSAEFAATLGEATELHAKISARELASAVDGKPTALPALVADLRADRAPDGRVVFRLPLALEREGRKSDLVVAGTLEPPKNKVQAFDGQVTSDQLALDDVKLLAAAAPTRPPGEAPAPWTGYQGKLSLQLKKLLVSDALELLNVSGRLVLEQGALKLETVQWGMGETGRAAVTGAVTFEPAAAEPYALVADVAVRDFDPAPLLRSAAGGAHAATVEGRFEISSQLNARGKTWSDLAFGANSIVQVKSKGGVFRGLPVTAGNVADSTSTIASLLASASAMLGGLTGRKDNVDVANRSQAVSELAKNLSAISYDQLNLVLRRDDGAAQVKEFSLIAPEVRLSGSGRAAPGTGGDWLTGALAMDFTLRAQGRTGDLLRYLGLLEPQPDDLGYSGCTVPIAVRGSLANVDASEASRRLVAAAFEKAGFMDKAAEWLTKQRNGK